MSKQSLKVSQEPLTLKFKKLRKEAKSPEKGTPFAAGIDLFSSVKVRLNSNNVVKIPTGIAFEIPEGFFGKIEERSGFSSQNTLVLKAGVIDSDYRGEILLVFQNCGDAPIVVDAGTKLAQMTLHPVPSVTIEETDELNETVRGTDGFGSTDKQ